MWRARRRPLRKRTSWGACGVSGGRRTRRTAGRTRPACQGLRPKRPATPLPNHQQPQAPHGAAFLTARLASKRHCSTTGIHSDVTFKRICVPLSVMYTPPAEERYASAGQSVAVIDKSRKRCTYPTQAQRRRAHPARKPALCGGRGGNRLGNERRGAPAACQAPGGQEEPQVARDRSTRDAVLSAPHRRFPNRQQPQSPRDVAFLTANRPRGPVRRGPRDRSCRRARPTSRRSAPARACRRG